MISFRLMNVKIDFETAEVFQMHLFVFSTVDFIGVPATGMLPPPARPPKDPDEDGEGDEGVDHRTRQPISPPVQRRVLHTRRSRREDTPREAIEDILHQGDQEDQQRDGSDSHVPAADRRPDVPDLRLEGQQQEQRLRDAVQGNAHQDSLTPAEKTDGESDNKLGAQADE